MKKAKIEARPITDYKCFGCTKRHKDINDLYYMDFCDEDFTDWAIKEYMATNENFDDGLSIVCGKCKDKILKKYRKYQKEGR